MGGGYIIGLPHGSLSAVADYCQKHGKAEHARPYQTNV